MRDERGLEHLYVSWPSKTYVNEVFLMKTAKILRKSGIAEYNETWEGHEMGSNSPWDGMAFGE